jgi:hypothetical protein
MKLQERIEIPEDAHEFESEEKMVRYWSEYPLEKHALKTYTLPIYQHFQVELHQITSYNARDCSGGVFEVFSIQGSVRGYGRRSYMVDVDFKNEIYNCQCCKIKRDGILRRHVLKVMTCLGVASKIPQHYILPHWCPTPPNIVP